MKTPGVYLLTMRLPKARRLTFAGAKRDFPSGYYVYVGSALGGLRGRVRRHVNFNKTPGTRKWHVDALLAVGKIVDIQMVATDDKSVECELAMSVSTWPEAESIDKFGSTDCHCRSHLFRFKSRPFMTPFSSTVMENFDKILKFFEKRYVNHAAFDRDPFETLVSCLLSLRTKDPVTDAAAKRLFREFGGPETFVAASPKRIETLIFPVGMYREKAKRLIQISTLLMEECQGEVPKEIDELTALPGVGRKTANLVRSFAFHLPALCVDTHAHRISNRWGLARTVNPDDTELALRRLLPERHWMELNPYFVQHGQQICHPLRPHCRRCGLSAWCHYRDLLAEEEVRSSISDAPNHPSLKVRPPLASDAPRQSKWLSPFES